VAGGLRGASGGGGSMLARRGGVGAAGRAAEDNWRGGGRLVGWRDRKRHCWRSGAAVEASGGRGSTGVRVQPGLRMPSPVAQNLVWPFLLFD
jgi:hypothetical protein